MGLFQKVYTPEQWEKYKKDNPELFDPNHSAYGLVKKYFDEMFEIVS